MRRLLLLVLGGIVLSSCGPQHSDLYLEANFKSLPNGTTVEVAEIGEGDNLLKEEMKVKKGKVVVDLPQSDKPRLMSLNFPIEGKEQKMFFLYENQPVKMRIYTDSLNSSKISGGEGNAKLEAYMSQVNVGDREMRAFHKRYSSEELSSPKVKNQLRIKKTELKNRLIAQRKELIGKYSDELFGLIPFSDLVYSHTATVSEMDRLFNGFSNEVKESSAGKFMKKETIKADPLALGNKAPGFSAPTPDGKELALEDALGKYTLIDFWAAWCMPCRRENPNLVRVYEKYHEKGFTILGVSLDRNKGSWVSAIEKDGLVWPQISNLKFWQDPIAQEYKIRSIPANLLLDENGMIIAKNLRGRALELKIGELLKE